MSNAISMNNLGKNILVVGPPGSGKTYLAEKFLGLGVNAFDADMINGLSKWVNQEGTKVHFPVNADKNWLLNHKFIWDKEFLKNFLNQNTPVIILGLSDNAFECEDLFDKKFYLNVDSETLEKRLTDPERKNPMGKTEEQKKSVLKFAQNIYETAKAEGFVALDATQNAKEILEIISQN